jgi:hypothetical protein
MAFKASNFKLMHHGAPSLQVSGLTPRRPTAFFHYTTNDNVGSLTSLGYFNAAKDLGIQAGDYIFAQANVDTTPIDIVSLQLVVTDTGINVGTSIHETGANLYWNTSTGATGADTNETLLFFTTLQGGLLNHDFMGVHFRCMLTTAANGNNKTIAAKLGGTTTNLSTTLITTGAVASNNDVVWLEVQLTRTGASAQQMVSRLVRGVATGGSNATTILGYATASLPTSGQIVFGVTGTNGTASANDIVLRAAQGQIIA